MLAAIRGHQGVKALKKVEPDSGSASSKSLQDSLRKQLARRRLAFGGQDSKRKEGLGVKDKEGLGGQNFASLSKLIPEPEDEADLGEDSTGIEGKTLFKHIFRKSSSSRIQRRSAGKGTVIMT